jgi:hypothetical protein
VKSISSGRRPPSAAFSQVHEPDRHNEVSKLQRKPGSAMLTGSSLTACTCRPYHLLILRLSTITRAFASWTSSWVRTVSIMRGSLRENTYCKSTEVRRGYFRWTSSHKCSSWPIAGRTSISPDLRRRNCLHGRSRLLVWSCWDVFRVGLRR